MRAAFSAFLAALHAFAHSMEAFHYELGRTFAT
jgi:hypothetical protein